ncbi:D-2-hydroxyacid dehydrogenase [Martelella sp. HB161492]|uniref:D-2-hydroxyacid dehydrogenase n=1 Tax=Martelella sp. HB161492 TaxID=2720726 RepID=UPI00159118A1|nr:D-2-hydroxyacid dehydrogenase [Martelella sp. HB161492]
MRDILVIDRDAGFYCDALGRAFPGFTFHRADTADSVSAPALESEVLIGLAPYLGDALLTRMPRLKWVHALTTGVDNLIAAPALGPDVVITNTHGMHGPQMSELAILMMLSLLRRFEQMMAQSRAGVWQRWPQPLLCGKTVTILGLGAIGEALAARCNAFGMTVTGISDGRQTVDGFARIFPRARRAEAAAEADFLVVIVPYSPKTHHIVDDAVLSAMRPGSYLINIARGGCVDEAALLSHLASGHLAGAGLDVFAVEPLPADSPFRALPNVIVTPHIGGMSDTYAAQALPLVKQHLAEFEAFGLKGITDRIIRG